ncbi:MAG: UDP-4-amino-4,6-dideoxy-N-acetyl-beta-L-altrosamine transaminase [bacterium]
MKKNIPYGHQWIDQSDIAAVTKALKDDWLTQGARVNEFEERIARYCGAKYGVAMSSGTAALHAAYAVIGIKKSVEVITTPMTFVATANAIVYCGGRPVFVDIEEDTLNIDPREIEKKITKNTKAISVVDFAGHSCDYNRILKIAKKHKLFLVEDACHALGAEYKGKKIGSFADLTVFSFHPVKAITTGEGGLVLTNSKDFYDKLKTFRSHGTIKKPEKGGWYYEIENPGYNCRLTDFQCALGISQLKKLDRFISCRRKIASQYDQAFKGIKEIKCLVEKDYAKSAYHIYPIRLQLKNLKAGRKEIFGEFRKQGLGVQVHYLPVHLHPFYQKAFGYKKGDFPNAEKYYGETVTIPLFPRMTATEVNQVISVVKKVIVSYRK